MLLREHLDEYTKEQLLDQARSFELRKCSGLRKAALIERILDCFCTEDMLRSRLACLTKEQMSLFRKACDVPQDVSINEVVDSMQLHMYWLGAFEEISDRFCAFEEVSAVFKRIDDEAFRAEQFKKGWMMKCVQFFIKYYGIAPVEVIYELYKLRVKDTIDEMITILWEMPIDIVESCIFPMRSLGLQDWPKGDPIYSSRGLFIHIPILENDEVGYLLDSQMDKSSKENYLYFTLPMALNYQRNSYTLWECANKTYKDIDTVDIFDTKAVVNMDEQLLREKLVKYKVALQPNKQPIIWRTICETVESEFKGDIRLLFSENDYSVKRIKEYIAKNKKKFPYLGGNKICNYWLYVMEQYTDVEFVDRENITVAPDTHVIQASERLGIISTDEVAQGNVQEIVASRWQEILKGTDLVPIDVHTPMWLWSRGKFSVEI